MFAATPNDTPAAPSRFVFPIAAVLFAWFWLDYSEYWIDDAFITFRYSRHIAEGLGPIYNPGERVEGYTSFLWMLIAALPLKLAGVSVTSLTMLKGLGFSLGLWTLYRTWTFPGPTGPARRWLVILLASNPLYVMNCGDGMETPLFMALMVEVLRALQRDAAPSSGTLVGALTAAMIWTRPESLPLLVALPAVVFSSHRGDPDGREARRAWLRAFLIAGFVPVLAHEAWRWIYYGYPFPNTYYAKATGSQWNRILRGWSDLKLFLYWNPWVRPVSIWLALGLTGLASWKLWRVRSPRIVVWLGGLWLMVLFRASFDLWSGSEAMGRHRFIAPLLVPSIILADEGARQLWRGAGRYLAVAVVVLSLGFNIYGHHAYVKSVTGYREGLLRGHIALGDWLRERYPRETVLAIGDAGTVPFLSGLVTIDLWGLNDGTIAHLPGEYGFRKGVADYVLDRGPDLIVLWNKVPFSHDGTRGVAGAKDMDRRIAKHDDFQANYRFVEEFVFRERAKGIHGYYLDVFQRKKPAPDSSSGRPHPGDPDG